MKKSLIFSFSFLGQIGFAVAIPLVILALIGRWFDHKFGTSPYLFLSGILISLPIAYFAVKKIATEALKELNNGN